MLMTMAPALRCTCDSCGPVEVAVADARLAVPLPDSGSVSANSVEFICPRCSRQVAQYVDERGTRLLSSAGITVVLGPSGDQGAGCPVVPGAGTG